MVKVDTRNLVHNGRGRSSDKRNRKKLGRVRDYQAERQRRLEIRGLLPPASGVRRRKASGKKADRSSGSDKRLGAPPAVLRRPAAATVAAPGETLAVLRRPAAARDAEASMPHAAARGPQPILPPAGRPQPHGATGAGQGAPAAASSTPLRKRSPESEMASKPSQSAQARAKALATVALASSPPVPLSVQESMAEMPQWHVSLRESHNQLQETVVKLRRDFQCHERWVVARDLAWRRRSEAAEKTAEDLSVELALAKCPPVPKWAAEGPSCTGRVRSESTVHRGHVLFAGARSEEEQRKNKSWSCMPGGRGSARGAFGSQRWAR